jgi:hypothetical protein
MPTLNELFGQLETFGSNLTKERKDALKAVVNNIKDRLNDFKDAVDKLDDDLNLDNEQKRIEAQERITEFVSSGLQPFLALTPDSLPATTTEIVALTKPAEEQTQMQQFFTDIAQSLIDAQQQLNLRSIEYLKHLALLEVHIPPAYFAIPSVKADLKVGFGQSEKKGVNLILFNKESQRKDYGESTLSFELVAAPPPPGAMPAGGFLVPIPGFLVLGDKHAQVLTAIQSEAEKLKKAKPNDPAAQAIAKVIDSKIYAHTAKELAVVLRHQSVPDKDDDDADAKTSARYLTLWPAQRDGAKPDSWDEMMIFDLAEQADGSLQLDGAIFEPKAPPPHNVLRIGSNAELAQMNPAALQALTLNLGNTLMSVVLALDEWRNSITDPRAKQ